MKLRLNTHLLFVRTQDEIETEVKGQHLLIVWRTLVYNKTYAI